MSGLNIHCGSFQGDEKSGSAINGVLKALPKIPKELVQSIDSQFESAEFALISVEQTVPLLPALVSYRHQLLEQIGHDDWWKKAMEEDAAGLEPVRAKWGDGLGWRLYCVTDLIKACEASQAQNCEIAICLC